MRLAKTSVPQLAATQTAAANDRHGHEPASMDAAHARQRDADNPPNVLRARQDPMERPARTSCSGVALETHDRHIGAGSQASRLASTDCRFYRHTYVQLADIDWSNSIPKKAGTTWTHNTRSNPGALDATVQPTQPRMTRPCRRPIPLTDDLLLAGKRVKPFVHARPGGDWGWPRSSRVNDRRFARYGARPGLLPGHGEAPRTHPHRHPRLLRHPAAPLARESSRRYDL